MVHTRQNALQDTPAEVRRLEVARGYSLEEAAGVLRLSVDSIRALVEQGAASPTLTGAKGEPRFSGEALKRLEAAAARQRRPAARRRPSNQLGFTFLCELPTLRQAADAEAFYEEGCRHEDEGALPAAQLAYASALAANPRHADAHLNLGRLLQLQGDWRSAEAHYRLACDVRPDDAVACFNLATALEDGGQLETAAACYSKAIALDPMLSDAYFNLARLLESRGDAVAALRHYGDYQRLTR